MPHRPDKVGTRLLWRDRAKTMGGALVLVGVLVLVAYTVGYLVGRAEMDRTWRWRTRFHRIGEQTQRIYIDEPGSPRMN